jgi:DNA-binding response OmpR family regulator
MDCRTILVADSDAVVAACIAEVLSAEGYTVYCHSGGLTAEAVEQARPDLVIVEQWHGQPDVAPLLDQLRRRSATRSMAVIVSSTDPWILLDLEESLHKYGCATLLKPFALDQLFDLVAGRLSRRTGQRAEGEPEPCYV